MLSLSAVRTGQTGRQPGVAYRMYASASSLDFPGLAQQFAFPDRKLTRARISFTDGRQGVSIPSDVCPWPDFQYFSRGHDTVLPAW